jgi:hypothetical protein
MTNDQRPKLQFLDNVFVTFPRQSTKWGPLPMRRIAMPRKTPLQPLGTPARAPHYKRRDPDRVVMFVCLGASLALLLLIAVETILTHGKSPL